MPLGRHNLPPWVTVSACRSPSLSPFKGSLFPTLPHKEQVLDTDFVNERKQSEWMNEVITSLALSYQGMTRPLGGGCRGNSPTQKRSAPQILCYLSEGGEPLLQHPRKASITSSCCLPGSVSSDTVRSSMCCQRLSDFPNEENGLPPGSAETLHFRCIIFKFCFHW